MTERHRGSLRAVLQCEPGAGLRGYAVDLRDPGARLAVEILADGEPVALLYADQGSDLVPNDLPGDGCHGFALPMAEVALAQTRRITLRLANTDHVLAAINPAGEKAPENLVPPQGRVAWTGGTRLSGHVPRGRDGEAPPTIRALLDGREVARTSALGWVVLPCGALARHFDLDLPAALADGRTRAVEIVAPDGRQLEGSPCLFVAFPDPLADWIEGWAELESEKPRARFADALLPRTLPFSAIEDWLDRFRPPALPERFGERVAVVTIGEAGREATLASLKAQQGVAWHAAALPSAGSPVGFDPARLRAIILGEASDCALVVLAVAGTRFEPQALARFAEAAALFPAAPAFYPDVLVQGDDGRRWPLAFPAFDPELFLETGYCGLVFALRRADLLQGEPADYSLYGLFPGGTSTPPQKRPVHLPFPLATVPNIQPRALLDPLASAARARLAAEGEAAAVEADAGPAARTVRVRRAGPSGSISALIAVRDRPAEIERTLALLGRSLGRGLDEIVLVDNESSDPGTLALLAAAEADGHRVLRVPGWFRPGRLLSLGAEAARGDHLLVVEAGVGEGEDGWLDEVRGRAAGRGVGVVGALVTSVSGVALHAGFALGPRCAPAPRFRDRRAGDSGYADLLLAAHGCSALSAACLLTPRVLFASLGGFDETFPRHLFAVDYCLRTRARDLRVVLAPRARLSSTDIPLINDGAPSRTLERETRALFERWAVVPGCDPSYSPWLAMDGAPYSGLAWPPASYQPRAGGIPAPSLPPFAL